MGRRNNNVNHIMAEQCKTIQRMFARDMFKNLDRRIKREISRLFSGAYRNKLEGIIMGLGLKKNKIDGVIMRSIALSSGDMSRMVQCRHTG